MRNDFLVERCNLAIFHVPGISEDDLSGPVLSIGVGNMAYVYISDSARVPQWCCSPPVFGIHILK